MKRFILAIICAGIAAGSFPCLVQFLAQEQPGKLARLIQDGKRAAAFEMIRSGADVNEAQLDGTRPVHWAVYRVDYDLLAELIAKKAKVDVTNEFGYTPLSEAAKQGDARMVKMLMDAGSGTEGANPDGQTALMFAIKNGDLPIFQMLIDAGAKVNVVEKVQEQTPLMWAAAATRNAAEMVRVLIAKDATVNARAKFNDWPSQITSEPRAQYHAYGGLTPLLYAARGGCLACVEALVNAGANVNLPTPEGATPMMIALDNNNNDVAKFLLEHRGNPNLWDVYGRTALYIAVDHAAGAAGRRCSPWRCVAEDEEVRGGAGGRGAAAPGAPVPAVPAAGQPGAGAQPPAGAQARSRARWRQRRRLGGPGGRWRRVVEARWWSAVVVGGAAVLMPAALVVVALRFRTWRSSTCCWRPVWIRIRNSTCVVPATRAGASAIRSSVREQRRCCAPWSAVTWKSLDFWWRRVPVRTSTAWDSRHSCMPPALRVRPIGRLAVAAVAAPPIRSFSISCSSMAPT